MKFFWAASGQRKARDRKTKTPLMIRLQRKTTYKLFCLVRGNTCPFFICSMFVITGTSGNFTPRKIPVNVLLPSGSNNSSDNLFGPPELNFSLASGPRIVMTSPERAPISGLVEITVSHDETKPRGVSVDIQGAMGCDLKLADLEEICRRGGTLSLSGRVWVAGHGSAS